MHPAHWHLLVNHAPVVGVLFGTGLLAFALWRRSEDVMRAATGFLVIVALTAIPAYMTGEPAEESFHETADAATHDIIHEHEEVAAYALGGALLLGLIAAAGLIKWRGGRVIPRGFAIGLLALSLVNCCLMIWTSNVGGQVRHTEIR